MGEVLSCAHPHIAQEQLGVVQVIVVPEEVQVHL
jgi:hypothetical protein